MRIILKWVSWWWAAHRRARGPDKAGPSSIFIRDGELEKIMGSSLENPLRGGGGAACGSGGGFVMNESTHSCTPPAEGNTHFHAMWCPCKGHERLL